MKYKLLIATVVLVGALAYLATAGIKSNWVYFLEVDKYLADQNFANQRVRLHGKVSTDNFSSSSGALQAQFVLLGHTKNLSVSYRGSIPDMFAPGRDVVIEGRRDGAGVFQADVLMTKCASKYQGQETPHSKAQAKS